MKVMKFGGTSVGRPERMHEVASLISKDSTPKVVVLSAVSGTTNALVEIADLLRKGEREDARNKIASLETQYNIFIDTLVRSTTAKEAATAVVQEHFEFLNIILKISFSEALSKDILAQGELLSTKLFSVYLSEEGVKHNLLPALEFMSIDSNDEPDIDIIREKLKKGIKASDANLFVTQGFICRNAKGEVDNLKRGGSDYSASLIAAALNADVCEIWTDISGMHNNDPRVVEKTLPIPYLSFDEAAELAYFGAKILHPASIWPAQQYNVPVRLLNTMEPEAEGTLISEKVHAKGAKAIAAKDDITAINIRSSRMLLAYGFLRKVFEVFENHKTPIDMITTSEVAVSVTIDNDAALKDIVSDLSRYGVVEATGGQTIVSIVGSDVAADTETLSLIFDALEGVEVKMVSYGGSPHNVSLLVPSLQKGHVLQQLNIKLFGLS